MGIIKIKPTRAAAVGMDEQPNSPAVDIQWEDATELMTRKVGLIQVYGDTGTGRTTLALTAPGPIAFIHCSEKIEGIVQKAVARGTKIKLFDFGHVHRGTPDQVIKSASASLDKFKTALAQAYKFIPPGGTIVLDTHTDLWELLRLARHGTLTPRGAIAPMYSLLNAEWESMFRYFRQQDKVNLVMVGKIREEYRNDKPTGKMIQAGHKEINFLGDVRIRTTRGKKGSFISTIEKGWFNALAEGSEFEDEDSNIPNIMETIFEDSWP